MAFGRSLVALRLVALAAFIDAIYDDSRQTAISSYIYSLQEGLKLDKGVQCNIPKIDPHYLRENTDCPIECEAGMNVVECNFSRCGINKLIKEVDNNTKCNYRDIIYKNDHRYTFGPPTLVYGDKEYKLNKSDHVEIVCERLKENHRKEIWFGHAAGFRPVPVRPSPPGREKTYNVLILIFDSTSKNGFIREMPTSYTFMKKVLKATFLHGYNIVGDGTPAALFPILTGKTELELPEYRKTISKNYIDSEYFIFQKLREDGYRTAYFEDMTEYGTFQYRFRGFRQQPVDHFLRHFISETHKKQQRFGIKKEPYCIGDTPQFQLMINLTDKFFKLDGKKFAFTFISDITHDSNLIGCSDESVHDFLKGLQERGSLKNTLLLVMGDHGPRYGYQRETLRGRLEERLPLMAIRLPDEMIIKRPDAQHALEMNANVLTTPHDIHATLLDVLDMTQHWDSYKVIGANLMRSLTLLEPIPKSRSCSEAGIEHHWCACLRWQKVNESDPMYERVPDAMLDLINYMTDLLRSKCVLKKLSRVHWVKKGLPNTKFTQFQNVADVDGYVAHFSSKPMKVDVEIYETTISVDPGGGTYEGVVTYNIDEDELHVSPRVISRINAYKDEPECISDTHPNLNQYCYCKINDRQLNSTKNKITSINKPTLRNTTTFENRFILMFENLYQSRFNTTKAPSQSAHPTSVVNQTERAPHLTNETTSEGPVG